jgi:RHS repeat-associated protein
VGFQDSTGTQYYVAQGKLGSIRTVVKRDGTWILSQRFTPYGTRFARDSAGAIPRLRYGWTGRAFDGETGRYYFRARYYDPGERRFTQEDPIGFAGGQNLFAYVGGNVLEATDPSGLLAKVVAIVCNFVLGCGPHGGGGGGGGGDADNDGIDDFDEFADYAFSRQLFFLNARSDNQADQTTQEQWNGIQWALDHGFTNAGAQRAVRAALAFGLVHTTRYLPCRADGGCPNGLTFLGLEAHGGKWYYPHEIWLNKRSDFWLSPDPTTVAFLLAHEIGHLESILSGTTLGQPAEERQQNCYAWHATGTYHPEIESSGYCQ